jgi:hypothetical protein
MYRQSFYLLQIFHITTGNGIYLSDGVGFPLFLTLNTPVWIRSESRRKSNADPKKLPVDRPMAMGGKPVPAPPIIRRLPNVENPRLPLGIGPNWAAEDICV